MAVLGPHAVAAQTDTSLTADDLYPVQIDPFGRPMVGVHVNGIGPLPFILDTGASRSVFYRSLTAMIPIEAVPNQSRRVATASGYKRAQVYPVEDLFVMGRTLNIADTVALPDIIGSEAKGLIGVDLLRGLALYLDMTGGTTRLITPERAEEISMPEAGWVRIQGRPVAYGSLALTVNIGGIDMPVIVDTGASSTVMNTAGQSAVTRQQDHGVGQEFVRATIAGARGVVPALTVPSFKVGAFERTDMRILVSDVPVFTLLGARRVPAIILGIDFLGNQPVIVDFENWRLYVKQPSAPLEAP